jgi:hypothetical protein
MKLPESLLEEVILEKCLSEEYCPYRDGTGFCTMEEENGEQPLCSQMASMTAFRDQDGRMKIRWLSINNIHDEVAGFFYDCYGIGGE